jgi:hypothetical protein
MDQPQDSPRYRDTVEGRITLRSTLVFSLVTILQTDVSGAQARRPAFLARVVPNLVEGVAGSRLFVSRSYPARPPRHRDGPALKPLGINKHVMPPVLRDSLASRPMWRGARAGRFGCIFPIKSRAGCYRGNPTSRSDRLGGREAPMAETGLLDGRSAKPSRVAGQRDRHGVRLGRGRCSRREPRSS